MGFGIIGYGTKTLANPSTTLPLSGGQAYVLPSGDYMVVPGKYTFIQWYDPVTTLWRALTTPAQPHPMLLSSDGNNYRLANLTGTVVGAVVTNAGTGYTNGIYYSTAAYPNGIPGNPNALPQAGTAAQPTVTFAAGGGTNLALGNVIVGGAINSTVAVTAGGTGYTYPPILIVSPPPAGGVQATMVTTITAGVVQVPTVIDQGAGYTTAPTITVVNHPLDKTGSGAVLTVNATLAGSGTITAITVPVNGAGHTSVPAITFSPASTTAATAIMCFTITTGVAQTNATHMATGNIGFALGALTAGSSVLVNPAIQTGLFNPRLAVTAFNTTAGGGITFLDGGLHQIIPSGIAYAVLSDGTISAAGTAVAQTVGGANDTSWFVEV